MLRLKIRSKKEKEIIDITEAIQKELRKQDFKNGLCHAFALHTTAALSTADLDPGTDLDMIDAFAEMIPQLKYRHPHDPEHVPDHILSSLIGPSILLPVENAEIVLGTWQRVVLIESSGPRDRELVLTLISK